MRVLLLAFALIAAPLASPLAAQDPGQDLSQMVNQQMAQAELDSSQYVQPPTFSKKAGAYPGPVLLAMRYPRHLRHTKIYYTIGDWTPTINSTLYTGPILVDRSETISAVITADGYTAAVVRHAAFAIPGSPVNPAAPLQSAALPAGTRVELAFTTAFDSRSAVAGQSIPLIVSEDLIVNHQIIAPKGTAAKGIITQVQPSRRLERPGRLAFRVDTLDLAGRTVALTGAEIKDGPLLGFKRNFLGFIFPPAGAAVIAQHGADAKIEPGAELQATVSVQTASASVPSVP